MSTELQALSYGEIIDRLRKKKIERRAQIELTLDGVQQDTFTSASYEVAKHNTDVINQAVRELRSVIRSKTAAGVRSDAALYDVLIALDHLYATMGDPTHYLFNQDEPQSTI